MRKLSQRRNHRDTAIIRACRQFTLSSDDSTQLLTVDDEIIEDLLEANKPIFLISMKRPAAMNKVNDLLERIDKGNLRAFIIDDEGDQASLNTKNSRMVERMLHEEARQEQAKNRNTPEYFAALRLRKIWCEGNFSHQKAEHNLRRTYKRGIERVTEQCLLSACAMNLIRLVKAANAVFIHCLGAIFQGLFRLGYLSTAPFYDALLQNLQLAVVLKWDSRHLANNLRTERLL